MKTRIPYLSIICIFAWPPTGKNQDILTGDYAELTDTKPVDKRPGINNGVTQLSWGSTDVRYSKLNVPSVNKTPTFADFRWKGERVNAQLFCGRPITLRSKPIGIRPYQRKSLFRVGYPN
jgi:hypothetical protein